MMHITHNICMTNHSYFPHTSTYSSAPHNSDRKNNSHHIPYTNTQHTSTFQGKKLFSTTAATQQTFSQTPIQSLQLAYKQKCAKYVHISIVHMHLTTRGNTKILGTLPPHISSDVEILPRLTRRTFTQLRTNKSPFLKSYVHKVNANSHPPPL